MRYAFDISTTDMTKRKEVIFWKLWQIWNEALFVANMLCIRVIVCS